MIYFKQPVIFVRHGETEWNLEKRTQGHLNSPLTKLGVSQAQKIATKLSRHNLDLIVSSPLGRALDTAQILSRKLNISDIQIVEALAERHLGILQGRTKEESLKLYPHFFGKNNRFIHSSEINQGENLQNFLERVKSAVHELEKLSQSHKLLVVTHDGVLHAIVSWVKGLEFDEVQQTYKFDHCDPLALT